MKKSSWLFTFLFPFALTAQDCIQGNCKNGYGVARTINVAEKSAAYLVGNFNANGKLEGEGMEITFHALNYQSTDKRHNEVDFLLLTSMGQPTLKEVTDLKPQIVKAGNFINGEMKGKATLIAVESYRLPQFEWIVAFGKKAMKAFSIDEIKYEGEFDGVKPSGKGQVTLTVYSGTMTTTGLNLTLSDNPDVILEINRKDLKGKGLFRGGFSKGYAHGWALTNMNSDTLLKDGRLIRELWVHGWPWSKRKPGEYPADEAGTKEYKPDAMHNYRVGLDAKGRPSGFGSLEKRTANGTLHYNYTGYFNEGQPMGEGLMEYADGSLKTGTFEGDTLIKGYSFIFDYNKKIAIYYGSDLYADGRVKSGYGTYQLYNNWTEFAKGGDYIQELYYGDWYDGRYHGKGMRKVKTYVQDGNWYAGSFSQGSTTIDRKQLQENYVIVLDGIASPVKIDRTNSTWVTLDGRKVPEGNIKLSKLPLSSFYGDCNVCNGSGKTSESHYVPPSSKLESKTVTTYSDASYINSYWKNTSTVTTETYREGHTYYTYKSCSSCFGNKRSMSRKSLPEPQ